MKHFFSLEACPFYYPTDVFEIDKKRSSRSFSNPILEGTSRDLEDPDCVPVLGCVMFYNNCVLFHNLGLS